MKKLFCLLCFFGFVFANTPQYGGTLVFARSADTISFDPAKIVDGESYYATTQVYDNLVQFKLGSTEVEPALAHKIDISDDGLEYTFHLRKGVYFNTTEWFSKKVEFSAADVLFSLKRQYDKNEPYNKTDGSFVYWNVLGLSELIKSIEAIDRYTVKITLNKPDAAFLANLAMDFASILCKTYADELLSKNQTSQLERLPVGTGAFTLVSWKKDDVMVFKASENYWNKRPFIDRLVLKVVPNSSIRIAELKSKQVQMIDFPNPNEIANLELSNDIKVVKQNGANVGFLALNTKKEPLNDVRVRQAINYAVNKEAIINSVYENLAIKAYSPIPPTILGHSESTKQYEYNLEKAKSLMKEAGLENGFSISLWAMPIARPYMNDATKVAQIIQDNLAKININAKIVVIDWATYLKKVTSLEHEMALYGWTGANGDPDNYMYVLLSKDALKTPTQNLANWENDEFSELVSKAKTTTDKEARKELYKKAQDIFANEAPWLPIAHSVVAVPMLKNIHGFSIDPLGKRRFLRVWIEK